MFFLLYTLISNPQKWTKLTDVSISQKTVLSWGLIFLPGIYSGFIQIGMGTMLLITLVLTANHRLRDANITKLILIFAGY